MQRLMSDSYNKYSVGPLGQKYLLPTEPFRVAPSITEGPLLANLTDNSVVIQCKTNIKTKVSVKAGGKKFTGNKSDTHEIEITGLSPDKDYNYTISYGSFDEEYSFHTAPHPGSRTKFTFTYASDSRSGNGGGSVIWVEQTLS